MQTTATFCLLDCLCPLPVASPPVPYVPFPLLFFSSLNSLKQHKNLAKSINFERAIRPPPFLHTRVSRRCSRTESILIYSEASWEWNSVCLLVHIGMEKWIWKLQFVKSETTEHHDSSRGGLGGEGKLITTASSSGAREILSLDLIWEKKGYRWQSAKCATEYGALPSTCSPF